MNDRRDTEISKCVEGALTNIQSRNVVSAFIKAFTDCFIKHFEGGKEIKSYVTEFSRVATKKLYNELKCRNIQNQLQQISAYLDTIYSQLTLLFDAVIRFRLVLHSRLSIDTKNPLLPLEISISWDPILNVPYIPASSLKGVVRTYLELNNIRDIDSIPIEVILGSASNSMSLIPSLIVFTDAYPVACSSTEQSLIDPDVVTPHYKEVNKCIDEVCVEPTPLVFPTLAKGVELSFIMAIDYGCDEIDKKCKLTSNTAMKIAEYVKKALETGIGSKTSVGYGRVKVNIIKQQPQIH